MKARNAKFRRAAAKPGFDNKSILVGFPGCRARIAAHVVETDFLTISLDEAIGSPHGQQGIGNRESKVPDLRLPEFPLAGRDCDFLEIVLPNSQMRKLSKMPLAVEVRGRNASWRPLFCGYDQIENPLKLTCNATGVLTSNGSEQRPAQGSISSRCGLEERNRIKIESAR